MLQNWGKSMKILNIQKLVKRTKLKYFEHILPFSFESIYHKNLNLKILEEQYEILKIPIVD